MSEGISNNLSTMPPDDKCVLDLPELQELYGDELLAALAREFVNSVPGMLHAVRAAVAAEDAQALFQSAHRLKSAISNLYSQPASEAAAELERMGRIQQLQGAQPALTLLEAELARLMEAVEALAVSGGAAEAGQITSR